MIKEIVKDEMFLKRKSLPATKADLPIGQDLRDTLQANKERCVGMAANMIGYSKRVIIVNIGFLNVVMFNSVILERKDPYQVSEGCLSLSGSRNTLRFKEVKVAFLDEKWENQELTLTGFAAEICQHEMDHLEGILI
ncbi:peptide deformylase [Lactobacillus jensenii]|jgi:peptide deformylase|uniref:Peptide deformylase n=2 Tax=Lactobacillales TaxID=186826 RepID=A0ABU9FHT0_LACJE|nr:peptide deformylase [Lactobacillus jensenii]EEQ67615.1 peptide deformylase [Lactobacillus jensenii 1153]ERJ44474.1 peptide deformylase [Lactobacillus jensenii MD IIE-70(2)]APT15099.1 peptide deformylase [Lactobacillus jensenii]EEQ24555.1 peptide deformylase [Lactobacillus jensenii 269-3]EEX26635.1 peptide deformylase [Lactobacillus jensenii SJ-7A-US]